MFSDTFCVLYPDVFAHCFPQEDNLRTDLQHPVLEPSTHTHALNGVHGGADLELASAGGCQSQYGAVQ